MISLATLATEFISRQELSQKTISSYTSALMPLVKEWGRTPLELVSRQLLEEHLQSLIHLAYTTQNRHLATIVALMNFAVDRGYLTTNPATRIKQRKPDSSKGEHRADSLIRYLSSEQLECLWRAVAPDVRLHAIVRLLYQTGARVSELLGLNLEGMDLEKRKFQVVGKGNKCRWCFYGEEAAIILEKYVRYYRHQEVKALFTAQKPFSRQVSRLSYARLYQSFIEALSSFPILEGVRFHDLRHTWATERVGLISLEQLRALMGHENIQTTLRYQKVTSLKAQEAAQIALNLLHQ